MFIRNTCGSFPLVKVPKNQLPNKMLSKFCETIFYNACFFGAQFLPLKFYSPNHVAQFLPLKFNYIDESA
jgi:hypothetical protein